MWVYMYELMCGYGYVRMGARVCNNVSIYYVFIMCLCMDLCT